MSTTLAIALAVYLAGAFGAGTFTVVQTLALVHSKQQRVSISGWSWVLRVVFWPVLVVIGMIAEMFEGV